MNAMNAIRVQGRVVWALMLREIHTIHGGTVLGYLWVIINSAFGVGVFWALRAFFGFRPPHGMSAPAFLIIGFCFWKIFSGIVQKSLAAVSGNRALLTFPQVTPLDLLLARTLILLATEIIVGGLLLGLSLLMGYPIGPVNWGGLMIAMVYIGGLSFSMGAFLTNMRLFIPPLDKVIPMVMRILFFCSGVFFSVDRMPYMARDILKWNPVLQLIELGRNSLAQSYVVYSVDMQYLTGWIILFSFFGLLLERYGRKYLAEAN